jgi:hypothetical protein
MNDDLQDRLLAAVREANRTPPVKFEKPSSVEVGQVRRLRAYDDDLETTLVLLLRVDDEVGFATVIGVSSPSDEATVRDLVVPRGTLGLPFDLVLKVDGVATAWTVQLSETPVVCSLPSDIVDLARRAPRMASHDLATEANAIGISAGSITPQTGDHLWWQIGRAAEHLAKLAAPCHEALVKQPIADPAILPSLILRGNESDRVAAVDLGNALHSKSVEPSPEGLSAFRETFLNATPPDPDIMRLLQSHFLEDLLRQSVDESPAPSASSKESSFAVARNLPEGLNDDPLELVVARCDQSGERSTRVWTSSHLWMRTTSVLHTQVRSHRHAIVVEFGPSSKERA